MKPDARELLALDVPVRLATLDEDGYPRITPLWFLWEDGVFYMTSVEGRRHLRNLQRDPRASICIDTEEREGPAGARRTRRVTAKGLVELRPDTDDDWTARITRKYVSGAEGEALARRRGSVARVVILLRPTRLVATRPRGSRR